MGILVSITSSLSSWIDHVAMALSLFDVVCIFAALLAIRACSYAGMWIYALVALPGTLAHELAHFIVALVLRAQPSFPSLIPVRTQYAWRLGSVTFRAGYLRALPIALAPLALAPLALWWAGHWLGAASWPLYGAHVWIVAALLSASLPSSADMKIALPALGILAVIVAVVVGLRWILSHG